MKASNVLEYKGYLGSAEISVEDGCLFGALLAIPDLVSYAADSYDGLVHGFREAVDGYIEFCGEQGRSPAKVSSAAALEAEILSAENELKARMESIRMSVRGKPRKTTTRKASQIPIHV